MTEPRAPGVPLKKARLERLLESLEAVPTPRPDLEQYPTPAGIAAEVAYIAHGKGDLAGARVLDLGCGNGILAIAAKLMGAAEVVGVDVDPLALQTAEGNARRVHVDVTWRQGDAATVQGPFDTALMNPPFGSQRRHADLPFLEKAMEVAHVVYSFHNGVTEEYVVRKAESRDARVTDRLHYEFPLRRAFAFHTDEERRIPVVLLRIQRVDG